MNFWYCMLICVYRWYFNLSNKLNHSTSFSISPWRQHDHSLPSQSHAINALLCCNQPRPPASVHTCPLLSARWFHCGMQDFPALFTGLIPCSQPCLSLTFASHLPLGKASASVAWTQVQSLSLVLLSCSWLFGNLPLWLLRWKFVIWRVNCCFTLWLRRGVSTPLKKLYLWVS